MHRPLDEQPLLGEHHLVVRRHVGPTEQGQPALGVASVAGVPGQRDQRQRPGRVKRFGLVEGLLGRPDLAQPLVGDGL